MIAFYEVVERAMRGPLCSERDFDLEVLTPKLREVVTKHGIKFDPQNPIPSDDGLADAVWAAGVELFEEVGAYCLDTERRILFQRREIEEALGEVSGGPVLGQGQDAKVFPARRPDDSTPPWCSVGAAGAPVSTEEIFISLVHSYATFPLTDSITTPSLANIDGRPIVAGSPREIDAAIRTVVLAKEGVRRAGRPGLPIINGVATAVKAAAHIAGHHFGLTRADALEIGAMAELKVDFDSLDKVAYSLSLGGPILAETGIILGGYAGGPEGAAVLTAAYNLLALLVLRGAFQHPFPIHFARQCCTGRDVLWARSVGNQAVSRNSGLPLLNVGQIAAGPNTKMCLYETAAWIIPSVVSGGSVEPVGVAHGTAIDHMTPIEPLFATEIAHAVVGMDRSEANDIVKDLLLKYEAHLDSPPAGDRYQDCFDVATMTPSPEYARLYNEVKKEMEGYGLRFEFGSPYS